MQLVFAVIAGQPSDSTDGVARIPMPQLLWQLLWAWDLQGWPPQKLLVRFIRRAV
jgi:hypothetical protein